MNRIPNDDLRDARHPTVRAICRDTCHENVRRSTLESIVNRAVNNFNNIIRRDTARNRSVGGQKRSLAERRLMHDNAVNPFFFFFSPRYRVSLRVLTYTRNL